MHEDALSGPEASVAEMTALENGWFEPLRVQEGDVAVVRCRSHQSGTILDTGEAWSESFRYADVWILDSRGWRIAARQATMRPKTT